jgi:hypothetical protein
MSSFRRLFPLQKRVIAAKSAASSQDEPFSQPFPLPARAGMERLLRYAAVAVADSAVVAGAWGDESSPHT